jgi:intracellular sulfur oxidation DsrE/DsrF family protein
MPFRQDVALITVQTNGLGLQSLSMSIKQDEEICLEAVRQNGMALQFCSGSMKNNKEVCYSPLSS